jgi:hypothetical protein
MTKLDLGSPRKYRRRYDTQGTFHSLRAYLQLRELQVRQHQLMISSFAARYLQKRRQNMRIQEEEERYNDDVVRLLCNYNDDDDKSEARNVDTS